jgi:glycosyltransferase involved in cell wall biosynthesis
LRILILNWRDIKHPRSGGAEFFTHEIAKRLVDAGNEVEWFTASFAGGAKEELIDGVNVVRSGQQWTVHTHAIGRYRGRLRGRFDAVIDEVNTIPFFTPLWADIPRLMLIFQLAREVWWYESRFPLSAIGYLAEPMYLRLYRDVPVLTAADSTLDDLRKLGFRNRLTTIPVGIEQISPSCPAVKEPVPTFIYVGRLAPSKRVDEIISAFAGYERVAGTAKLWLVGEGPDEGRLQRHVSRLGITPDVEFLGRIPQDEKHRRMARAHMLLMASAREGWGLVVTEANACGTPAVVYDVPGLRDSVRHGESGLVVHPRPEALTAGMLTMTRNPELYDRLATEARNWSRRLNFDATAAAVQHELLRSSSS